MRYWLMSMAIGLFLAAAGTSQEPKKGKDTGKEPKSENTPEPKDYLGKTFEQWKKEIHSPDPSKRETAMKAVLFFKIDKSYTAVPDIIAELKKHEKPPGVDLSVRVNGVMALNTIFRYKEKPDDKHVTDALAIYRMFLKDEQVMMRMRALQGVGILGPAARELLGPAARELLIEDVIKQVKYLGTWEVRKEAIPILTMLAPDGKGVPLPKAISELRIRLKDAACPVRVVALQGLTILNTTNSLVDIRKALDDPCSEVRMTAISAYANLSGKMVLKDKTISVQQLNAHIKLAKEEINLKFLSHAAIMTITEKVNKEHMDPIIEGLKHKDPKVRVDALKVLSMGGIKAKPLAYKPVLKAVDEEDLNVAVSAIVTLVHMHCFDAIPKLETIKKDKKANEVLVAAAEEALDNFTMIKAEIEKQKKKDAKTPDKK